MRRILVMDMSMADAYEITTQAEAQNEEGRDRRISVHAH